MAAVQFLETGSTSQDNYYKEVTIGDIIKWLKFEVFVGDYELICIGVAIGHPGFGLRETEQQLRDNFNVPAMAIEDRWPNGQFSRNEALEHLAEVATLVGKQHGTGEEALHLALALSKASTLQ